MPSAVKRTRAFGSFGGMASLGAIQLVLSLYAASQVRTVATVDTANYYVIARNFAEGRGLTDTVLWQFLAPPNAVERAAGDYWEVGWPLLLGTLMRVFGTSQHAAILACACLSSLLPVAVFALAYAVRRRLETAWLAGLLVCLQTRLAAPDVTPDVTLLYQLTCLTGLAAALRLGGHKPSFARLVGVGVLLGLPIHVRGEGFLPLLAALPAIALQDRARAWERGRRVASVVLGVCVVSGPFWARNLSVLGHVLPPSHAQRLWLTRYTDLFRYLSAPSPERFWSQSWTRLLRLRQAALERHLDLLTLHVPLALLALAVVGVVALMVAQPRRQAARGLVLPLFVVLSLLVPCLVVPIIANDGRFVLNVLPVVCVLGSLGLVAVADGIARRAASPLLGVLLVSGGAILSTVLYRPPTTMRTALRYLEAYRRTPECVSSSALAELELRPYDVVMADDAWRVAAVLGVAAVRGPIDGPRAEDEVIVRYHPRYLLADSGELKLLAKRRRLRQVAEMPDGTWYAFDP